MTCMNGRHAWFCKVSWRPVRGMTLHYQGIVLPLKPAPPPAGANRHCCLCDLIHQHGVALGRSPPAALRSCLSLWCIKRGEWMDARGLLRLPAGQRCRAGHSALRGTGGVKLPQELEEVVLGPGPCYVTAPCYHTFG